jgi:glycosyltransferase involved in cell wall biosynthesis
VRALSPSIPYKSFGLFQAALSLIDEQGVRLHVLAVGEKGYIPEHLKHVTYTDLGAVMGDLALAEVYRACDFFVSCSIQDAGPMMIGEAMACGRPSIAYPIGIAPDLIEQGRNGTIIQPVGDVAALAAALREYAEMPSAELLARQQAAADSAGRIFSAGYFAQQVQAALRR